MRLRLTYVAVGIVISLGAGALVYQFGFGAGKLNANHPQASATQAGRGLSAREAVQKNSSAETFPSAGMSALR